MLDLKCFYNKRWVCPSFSISNPGMGDCPNLSPIAVVKISIAVLIRLKCRRETSDPKTSQ